MTDQCQRCDSDRPAGPWNGAGGFTLLCGLCKLQVSLRGVGMPTRIVKRYSVNISGNRFARVAFDDGSIVDVKIRDGRGGVEVRGANEIKRLAMVEKARRE
jgi:hypothetical protein